MTPSTTPMRYPKLMITSMMAPAKAHSANELCAGECSVSARMVDAEISEHPPSGSPSGPCCRYRRRQTARWRRQARRRHRSSRSTAPDFSSSNRAVHRKTSRLSAGHRGEQLAMPLVRNSLSRSADFCRATSRLDTSSSMEMAMMPHTAPISALLCASTPQSTSCCKTAEIGHHKVSSPRLGRNHAVAYRLVLESRTGCHPEHEEADEGDRQRQVSSAPPPDQDDRNSESETDKDLRPHRAPSRAWPSSMARA